MKKAVISLLILILCFTLCACLDVEEEPIEFDPSIPHISISEYYDNLDEYFEKEVYTEGYVSVTYKEDHGDQNYRYKYSDYEIILVSDPSEVSGKELYYRIARKYRKNRTQEWDDEKKKVREGAFGFIIDVNEEQFNKVDPGDYIVIKGIAGKSLPYTGSDERWKGEIFHYNYDFILDTILDVQHNKK